MSLREQVRRELHAHEPGELPERRCHERILALYDWLEDPLDEHADPFHVTGSAIVVSDDDRILLHRHKRLGVWLQPGGHLDAGESPADAAVRETREETGLSGTHHGGRPSLVHVDVHEGPRGHVHLDLRYLLHADASEGLAPAPGESPDVRWWHTGELQQVADGSLAAAVRAARVRLGSHTSA